MRNDEVAPYEHDTPLYSTFPRALWERNRLEMLFKSIISYLDNHKRIPNEICEEISDLLWRYNETND